MARDYGQTSSNTYGNTQFTLINNKDLNNKWDKLSKQNCMINLDDVKDDVVTNEFTLKNSGKYLPYSSMQGVTMDSHYNIYILGGDSNASGILAIPWHKLKYYAKNSWSNQNNVSFLKESYCHDINSHSKFEPEGVQCELLLSKGRSISLTLNVEFGVSKISFESMDYICNM